MALYALFLPAFWGRGYATESCDAIIRLYANLSERIAGLPRVVCAYTHKPNDASIRVCDKLGFVKITGCRIRGRFLALGDQLDHDIVYFERVL
jgi:RimJ/RimL family protein N-acetyltransferase